MSISEKDIKICGHGSGTPSVKSLYTYTAQRYAKKAPNGKHKGIAAVKRLKTMTDEGRKEFVKTYDTILGRNIYSQAKRAYVYTRYSNGKYYSDCSSSIMATMKRCGFNIGDWLLNTAAIYESSLFETVPVTIKDGHITNPEILKVADCILYIGSDPKRPKQIGHVEAVYSMPTIQPDGKVRKAYDGKFPTLPARGYFKRPDGYNSDADMVKHIKRVQKLVKWITGEKLSADGKYGAKTEAAVKQAQRILGVTVDGEFGKQTLSAAKKYKK